MNTTSSISMMFRKELAEKSKMLIYGSLAYIAITFMIGMLISYVNSGGGSGTVFFYTFLYFFLTPIVASFSFPEMKKKEGRLRMLMTLATPTCKVLPRLVIMLICWAILGILGYFAMEVGQAFMEWARFGEVSETTFFNPLSLLGDDPNSGWAIALTIGGWFVCFTYFFMGGMLWSRYSYLISIGVIWILQFVLTGILMMFPLPHFAIQLGPTSLDVFLKTLTVVFYILGVVMAWLTVLRLKHSKVIYGIFR